MNQDEALARIQQALIRPEFEDQTPPANLDELVEWVELELEAKAQFWASFQREAKIHREAVSYVLEQGRAWRKMGHHVKADAVVDLMPVLRAGIEESRAPKEDTLIGKVEL